MKVIFFVNATINIYQQNALTALIIYVFGMKKNQGRLYNRGICIK